jgi:hypothetical protein
MEGEICEKSVAFSIAEQNRKRELKEEVSHPASPFASCAGK